MITSIHTHSLKGLTLGVELNFKPVTLLFGPNSAGKSTLLQALLYAHEILARHNLDPDHTALGGRSVDLGGFRNLVHNHDLTRPIELAFDLDVRDVTLSPEDDEDAGAFLLSRVETARVLLRVEWSTLDERPQLTRYAVDFNGKPFGHIAASLDGHSVHATLAGAHPLWEDEEQTLPGYNHCDKALAIRGQRSALPPWNLDLDLPGLSEEKGDWETRNARAVLQGAFVELGDLLRRELSNLLYLGPLRDVPPRNHQPARSPSPGRWAAGLAAWDALHSFPDLVRRTNRWLTRLEAGYRLRLRRIRELDEDSPLAIALRTGRAFDDVDDLAAALDRLPEHRELRLVDDERQIELLPPDIGTGLSQVLPVVVAALTPGEHLVAIEQPELHVHPAIQVGLGDLLIEEATKGKTFLVETHSEHLVLRLIRRIRETHDDELPPGAPALTPDRVAIHWVEQGEDGVTVTPLRLDAEGEFLDHWPRGFFEERAEELFG